MAMSLQSFRESQRTRGTASILAMATETPANHYFQSEFPDFYFRVTNSDHMTDLKDKFHHISHPKTKSWLRPCTGENSAVRKRHMCLTEEILRNNPSITSKEFEPSLAARHEILARQVPLLGMKAALKAIEEWGRPVSHITHLVFATSCGVECPTADCRLAQLLGLRPSVARHFVFHQLTSSGSTVLRLAKDLAENNAGARVLVVCSDSIAVGFSAPSPARPSMLVGHAIFGDGAAAAIVGALTSTSESPLFKIMFASQTLVPGSDDAIVARLGESGTVHTLSPELLRYIGDNLEEVLEQALGENYDRNSLFYAVHPGSSAVLDKVEERLGLGPEKLRASRHVLSEYGNMWGPSVLFVLDELRRKSVAERKATTGDGLDLGVMVTFGPGFTVETIVLRSEVIV